MALKADFEEITKKAYLENAFRVEAEIAGLKSGNISSVHDRTAAATREAYHKVFNAQAAKEQGAFEDAMWLAAINAANDRIRVLDNNIEKGLETLYEVYGGPEGLADAFLTDEEREGLETEEEIIEALVDKYLDENGELKPEYADLDPRLVSVLKDWHERNTLTDIVNDPNATPEEKAAALEGANYEQATRAAEVANNEFAQEKAQEVKEDLRVDASTSGGFTIGG